MIEIIYKLNNRKIEFSSIGHANYDSYGKDIICASVSSVIIGALNAIKNIESFDIKIKKGDIKLNSINEISEHDLIVLETMYTQLKTIEEQFPKNLKVNEGSKI